MSKGVQNNRFWLKAFALSLGIRTSNLVSTRHHRTTLDERQTTNCFFPSSGPAITLQRAPRGEAALPGQKAWIWTAFRRSNRQILKTLANNLHCPSKCILPFPLHSLHVNVACLTAVIGIKLFLPAGESDRNDIQYCRDIFTPYKVISYPCNERKYLNYYLQGHQDGQVGIVSLTTHFCRSFKYSSTTSGSL